MNCEAREGALGYKVNCEARQGALGYQVKRLMVCLPLLLGCLPMLASAEPGLAALKVEAGEDGSETYTVSIQVLMFMTALSLLPAALMMMTSFTRIVIVLAILRQALGTQNTPSNQILIGLALFLTLVIMAPVTSRINEEALQPLLADRDWRVRLVASERAPIDMLRAMPEDEDEDVREIVRQRLAEC